MDVKEKGKPGRPRLPAGVAKYGRFGIRLTCQMRALVEAAAKRSSMSVSEWVRKALEDFARRGK